MNRLKKAFIFILSFLLIFTFIPQNSNFASAAEYTSEELNLSWGEKTGINDISGKTYVKDERVSMTAFLKVTPGDSITLNSSDYEFILYGYTDDNGTYSADSYIDVDPNSSSNWGTSYTFKQNFTYGSGKAGMYPLYIRMVVRNAKNTSALITVGEVKDLFVFNIGGNDNSYGDADADGDIDLIDLLKLKKYINTKNTDIALEQCDFDNDYVGDVGDLNSLRNKFLKKISNVSFAQIAESVEVNGKTFNSDMSAIDLNNSSNGEIQFSASDANGKTAYFDRTGKDFVAEFDAEVTSLESNAQSDASRDNFIGVTVGDGENNSKIMLGDGRIDITDSNGKASNDITDAETRYSANSYIDVNPNSSSNWGTSYTFKESFTYGSGKAGEYPLYVRLVVRSTTGANVTADVKSLFSFNIGGESKPSNDFTWSADTAIDDWIGVTYSRTNWVTMTDFIKVMPGDTITLDSSDCEFILYGYTANKGTFSEIGDKAKISFAKSQDTLYVSVDGKIVLAQQWSNIFPSYNAGNIYAVGLTLESQNSISFKISNIKVGTKDSSGTEFMCYKHFGFDRNIKETADVNLMSYNVLFSSTICEYPRVIGQISQVLHYKPDVVGIQEADSNIRNAWTNELINKSSYAWVETDMDNNYTKLAYNTDLLEIADSQCGTQAYSYGTATMRNMTWAKFRNKLTDKTFYVINTHWDTSNNGADSTGQVKQSQELAQFVKTKTDAPCFVMGDFNRYYETQSYTDFITNAGLSEAYKKASIKGETISSWVDNWNMGKKTFVKENENDSTRVVDHISYSSEIVSEYYTVVFNDTAYKSSDHFPIFSKFNFAND